ncbi:hypothetical protein FSP39_015845 [Pinctada imbricata]|uniref:EF-hand domain-containing protein n=1 Tax=Pinctada imbricata TaxID=66713 RepID=A0AA88XJA1_PINIB|nr:hypothetical protein FSP39_015845 [Pinctada imbricata]
MSSDDGAISWEEFVSFFSDGVMGKSELQDLFNEIDTHNTNNIDTGELCEYFSKHLGPMKEVYALVEELQQKVTNVLFSTSESYPKLSRSDQFFQRFLMREVINQISALQTPLETASDHLDEQARKERSDIAPIESKDVVKQPDVVPGRIGRRARRQISNQSQASDTPAALTSQVDRLATLLDRLEHGVNFKGFVDEDLNATENDQNVLVQREMKILQEKKEEFNKVIRQYIEDTNNAEGAMNVSIRYFKDSGYFTLYEVWQAEKQYEDYEASGKFKAKFKDLLEEEESPRSVTFPVLRHRYSSSYQRSRELARVVTAPCVCVADFQLVIMPLVASFQPTTYQHGYAGMSNLPPIKYHQAVSFVHRGERQQPPREFPIEPLGPKRKPQQEPSEAFLKCNCPDSLIEAKPIVKSAPPHEVKTAVAEIELVRRPPSRSRKLPSKRHVFQTKFGAMDSEMVDNLVHQIRWTSTTKHASGEAALPIPETALPESTLERSADIVRLRGQKYELTPHHWQRAVFWDYLQPRGVVKHSDLEERSYGKPEKLLIKRHRMEKGREKKRVNTGKIRQLIRADNLSSVYTRPCPGYAGFVPRSPPEGEMVKTTEHSSMVSTMKATYRKLPEDEYKTREHARKGPLSKTVTLTYPFNPYNKNIKSA